MKKNILLGFGLLILLSSCGSESKNEEVSENQQQETVVEESIEPSSVGGEVYSINLEQSVINWKGSKILDPSEGHYGTIKFKNGEITLNEGKIVAGSFVADMNSIECLDLKPEEGKAKLEGHLKGTEEENKDHFFNVSEFPVANFIIKSIDGNIVKGDLDIKGNINSEEFEAKITQNEEVISIESSEFKIDRTKYKVEYGSATTFADLAKDKVISDNIKLQIKLVLQK